MIPRVAEQSIKEMIRKNQDTTSYIGMMVECWKMDGFASKLEAKYAYGDFVVAEQIKRYLRKHGYSTRKGTYHGFNCQVDDRELWNIVTRGAMNGQVDNVRWEWRKVDQLRNVRVWF